MHFGDNKINPKSDVKPPLCEIVFKKENFLQCSPSSHCPIHHNQMMVPVNMGNNSNNNNHHQHAHHHSNNIKSENNIQSVTQELVNIIKNFQQQLHEIPGKSSSGMDEIPSGVLEPKKKEFFKKSNQPPADTKSVTSSNNSDSKTPKKVATATDTTPRKSNASSSTLSSLKSKFSKNSMSTRSTSFNGTKRQPSFTSENSSITSRSSLKRFRSLSSSPPDPLKLMKEEVQKAIREHRTFTIRGHFPAVRKALLERGWVERYHISYRDQLNEELRRYQTYSISELLSLSRDKDLTTLCKNLIKSKLLGSYQVDFYWGMNDQAFKENPDNIKFTLINKLKRDIFSYTNKLGLCDANKNAHWYQIPNVSKLNHPRSYNLGKNAEKKEFTDDFRLTAAMSLLKWVIQTNNTKECKIISPTGKIPVEVFDFALNECCKYLKRAKHEDIDADMEDAKDEEWDQFIEYFYKIVHFSHHLKKEKMITEESLIKKSVFMLNSLKEIYPFVDMDGMMNIWILKPTASSRGRGIHICRTLQYIMKTVSQHSNVRYIIQKYIERPLLIHKTKFDIRQWFLISSTTPLTIWIYKDLYLRFSSQTYNLRKLHESIHLTNNAVQSKYKNTSIDCALPSYNMWDLPAFQTYLSNIGFPNAFKNVVYPGMKQSITAAVLMHQEKMVVRKNCFELYGADFILTEDFQPWLLEINSNPALHASTPITSRLCPQVLEDVIKVVVDFARNNKASTGRFEMIFKDQVDKLPLSGDLAIKGEQVNNGYFYTPTGSSGIPAASSMAPQQIQPHKVANNQLVPINAFNCNLQLQAAAVPRENVFVKQQEFLKKFGDEIKQTLKNLLDIVHNEKHKYDIRHQKVGCD